jgi:hypothetical protein
MGSSSRALYVLLLSIVISSLSTHTHTHTNYGENSLGINQFEKNKLCSAITSINFHSKARIQIPKLDLNGNGCTSLMLSLIQIYLGICFEKKSHLPIKCD